jgi:hypothetical protein
VNQDRYPSEKAELAEAARARRRAERADAPLRSYSVKKITLRYIGTALPLLILALILLYTMR